MKRAHTIIIAGLAFLGLAGFVGYYRNSQREVISEKKNSSPCNVILRSQYGKDVGRTARFLLSAMDDKGIKSARLFEDEKQIQEFDGLTGYKLFDVTKTESGKHDYFLEVSDEDDNIVRTPSVSVSYSGNIEDRVPNSVSIQTRNDNESGSRVELILYASDFGDNAGIERAVLYENRKPFMQFSEFAGMKSVDITKTEKGEFSYIFEVTDKGGHSARSYSVMVPFNP